MELNLVNNQHHFSKMDGLDWSNEFQQLIMPGSSNALVYRDNYIPVQQIPRIDNSGPNLLKSPFHCPILDPASPNLTGSFDCLLSGSNQTDTEDDGISLIFSNCKTSLMNNNMEIAKNGSAKRKRADEKKPVPEKKPSSINFKRGGSEEPDAEAIAHMKEIVYQAAAFRPVEFGAEETERRPKRKNVRISSDPQTVAARERRERISERIRVLQRLVPGGSKMDTASMLDEAASYLKFLRSQVKALEALGGQGMDPAIGIGAFGYSPYLSYPFGGQGPNPVRKPESC